MWEICASSASQVGTQPAAPWGTGGCSNQTGSPKLAQGWEVWTFGLKFCVEDICPNEELRVPAGLEELLEEWGWPMVECWSGSGCVSGPLMGYLQQVFSPVPSPFTSLNVISMATWCSQHRPGPFSVSYQLPSYPVMFCPSGSSPLWTCQGTLVFLTHSTLPGLLKDLRGARWGNWHPDFRIMSPACRCGSVTEHQLWTKRS